MAHIELDYSEPYGEIINGTHRAGFSGLKMFSECSADMLAPSSWDWTQTALNDKEGRHIGWRGTM